VRRAESGVTIPPGGAATVEFWRQEAAGFEARLNDVLAALDEAGVDPHDKLEEGDAVRALAAERNAFRSALQTIASRADYFRDLVDAIREELGLLEVHDDDKLLRELAELKAIRAALGAEHGEYVGGALS